jgi:hypothetical protein
VSLAGPKLAASPMRQVIGRSNNPPRISLHFRPGSLGPAGRGFGVHQSGVCWAKTGPRNIRSLAEELANSGPRANRLQ